MDYTHGLSVEFLSTRLVFIQSKRGVYVRRFIRGRVVFRSSNWVTELEELRLQVIDTEDSPYEGWINQLKTTD